MKFDLMSCAVAVAGDIRQVVHIGETKDLTWPEITILRVIHGDHSVTKIRVEGETDLSPDVELERLRKKYPNECALLYSGYAPSLPAKAPDHIERFDDEVIERTVIRRSKDAVKAPEPQANVAPKPDRTAAARAAKAAKKAAEADAKPADGAPEDDATGGDGGSTGNEGGAND